MGDSADLDSVQQRQDMAQPSSSPASVSLEDMLDISLADFSFVPPVNADLGSPAKSLLEFDFLQTDAIESGVHGVSTSSEKSTVVKGGNECTEQSCSQVQNNDNSGGSSSSTTIPNLPDPRPSAVVHSEGDTDSRNPLAAPESQTQDCLASTSKDDPKENKDTTSSGEHNEDPSPANTSNSDNADDSAASGSNVQQSASGDQLRRPPFSFIYLIHQAIYNSPQQRLTLSEIYESIMARYPYYHRLANSDEKQQWQNSVRHNLSIDPSFVKWKRPFGMPGKGNFWIIHPECTKMFADGGIKRRKSVLKKGKRPLLLPSNAMGSMNITQPLYTMTNSQDSRQNVLFDTQIKGNGTQSRDGGINGANSTVSNKNGMINDSQIEDHLVQLLAAKAAEADGSNGQHSNYSQYSRQTGEAIPRALQYSNFDSSQMSQYRNSMHLDQAQSQNKWAQSNGMQSTNTITQMTNAQQLYTKSPSMPMDRPHYPTSTGVSNDTLQLANPQHSQDVQTQRYIENQQWNNSLPPTKPVGMQWQQNPIYQSKFAGSSITHDDNKNKCVQQQASYSVPSGSSNGYTTDRTSSHVHNFHELGNISYGTKMASISGTSGSVQAPQSSAENTSSPHMNVRSTPRGQSIGPMASSGYQRQRVNRQHPYQQALSNTANADRAMTYPYNHQNTQSTGQSTQTTADYYQAQQYPMYAAQPQYPPLQDVTNKTTSVQINGFDALGMPRSSPSSYVTQQASADLHQSSTPQNIHSQLRSGQTMLSGQDAMNRAQSIQQVSYYNTGYNDGAPYNPTPNAFGISPNGQSGNYNGHSGNLNGQSGNFNGLQSVIFNGQGGNVNGLSGNFNGQSGNDNGQSGNFNGQSGNFNGQIGNFNGQSGSFNGQSGNVNGQSGNFNMHGQGNSYAGAARPTNMSRDLGNPATYGFGQK